MTNRTLLLASIGTLISPLAAWAGPVPEVHGTTSCLQDHAFWLSTVFPFVLAMTASACVFRFAFNRR